jgi:hypothetical protein
VLIHRSKAPFQRTTGRHLTGKLTIPQLAFDLIVDEWVGDLASTEMADHTFRITDHPPGTTAKKHVIRLVRYVRPPNRRTVESLTSARITDRSTDLPTGSEGPSRNGSLCIASRADVVT